MRFVATADFHLHPFRQCSMDAGRDRLEDGLSALEQTLEAADACKCPWVFLGDLKHVKSVWYQYALNRAQEIFSKYKLVPKIMVHGNHDGLAGGSGLLPFLSETCMVFDKPGLLDWSKLRAAVWPHGSDANSRLDFLSSAKRKGVKVLLGHIFFANAVVGAKDLPLIKGASLHEFGLAEGDGRGPTFDWAFVGDVHKQQILAGSGGENATVIYPGSPLAINWGEAELDKGALLVDLDSATTIKPIPIKAPRFRTVDLTSKPSVQSVKEWAGDFVRVLAGPEWTQKSLDDMKRVSGARWFEVVVRRPQKKAELRADVHAGLPTKTLLGRYVKTRPLPDADDAMLLRVGLKLAGEKEE